jgi:hypothetical protein
LTPVGGRREHGRVPIHVPRGQISMGDLDGTAREGERQKWPKGD